MKKEINKKYNSSRYLIKRLFTNYISPSKHKLSLSFLFMIVNACTTAFGAWIIQPSLDYIFINQNYYMLYIIPLIIVLNSIISGVASFYESVLMKRVGQEIVANIQIELYEHLIHADLTFLFQFPSGNLISRFTNDINMLKNVTSKIFTGIIKEFITLLGLLSVMFYQSFSLTLIVILTFPLSFYPVIKLGNKMKMLSKNMQEKLGDFTVRLDETFQNIKIIKSYCREKYEINRAKIILNKLLSLFKRAAYIESASSPIMEIIGGIAVAMIIFYGGVEVMNNKTTTGAFFSFIVALISAYKPLKSLSKLNTLMQEGLSSSRRLFLMLDVSPEVKMKQDKKNLILKKFDITFNNVSFLYQYNNIILDKININIKQGQTTALIGRSGVGKSTIFNLLQKLYNVNCGEISIGGINIENIKLNILRQNIAFVSQDINLFDDTIMENIKYGKLNATNKEVIDASIIASAHEFIKKLPQQYNTHIGQNGMKLSGGQKQRLSIARAVLKNAPILLLDEATSALDSISEEKIHASLNDFKKDKTTIIIGHKISAIKCVDNIFFLFQGKIHKFNSYNDFILNSKIYTNFISVKN